MEDLQTLVRARLDHLERTRNFQAVQAVRRAAQAGRRITGARLSQIRDMPTGAQWTATPETIWAIAHGLDLPVVRVADAAMRSRGLPMPTRRYGHKREQTTVRGICADCTARMGDFDELVVAIPQQDLTPAEKAELVQAIENVVTQMFEQRGRVTYANEQSGA